MAQSFCCRLARQLAIFPQNGRQPQGFEAMIQQDFRCFGPADCPSTKDTQLVLDVMQTLARGR